MKAKISCSLVVLSAFVFNSCESKTGTGALIGAGAGTVAGALIGGNATGALVGAAIGAGAGALIGYALDENDRSKLQQSSPQTVQRIDNKQQLSIDDIKAMSKAQISDDVIISQIKATGSVFRLATDQIVSLKDVGVSQRVIDYMISTGT
jgi:outer membrane lipoprotein SlyB